MKTVHVDYYSAAQSLAASGLADRLERGEPPDWRAIPGPMELRRLMGDVAIGREAEGPDDAVADGDDWAAGIFGRGE